MATPARGSCGRSPRGDAQPQRVAVGSKYVTIQSCLFYILLFSLLGANGVTGGVASSGYCLQKNVYTAYIWGNVLSWNEEEIFDFWNFDLASSGCDAQLCYLISGDFTVEWLIDSSRDQ